jgi:para-aminobenzoate synthetase component 1
VRELVPAPRPWDVCRRLADYPHLVFFDSALGHPQQGRYSFVTADPWEWLWSRGRYTHLSGRSRPLDDTDPFTVLRERLARFPSQALPGLPPFQGGAAGLFGYDLCHHLEKLPRPRFDDFEAPDLAIGLYDWVVAFDHALNRAWLISTGFPETEPRRQRRRADQRLREIERKLTRTGQNGRVGVPGSSATALGISDLAPQWPVAGQASLTSSFDQAGYLDAVERAIEYIRAGDCFQVNIAQRLLGPARLSPLELYGRLRARNAATFAAYFDAGDFAIASASPERFLRVDDRAVETRPIKGTRPRGLTPQDDAGQIRELLASAKDRAENVMIVDLLRNDLGRVCDYGSVRVPAVCRLETYSFVHHLVSEVRGRLRSGLGPIDLLRAAFPGGSVTGAPKIRSMEIIAELEPTARGPYCGSLGYIGFDGSMDTSILIRTFTIGRGWLQFPVGGGIVADSTPRREYEETWHKAAGLLRALE